MRRWQGLDIEAEGTGISTPLSEQINLLGTMLGRDRLATPVLRLLHGAGPGLTAGLVAATRTTRR